MTKRRIKVKRKTNLTSDKLYIKSLRLNLGKMTDIKKAFIADIKEDIHRYMNVHPDASIDSLYEFFGDPEAISMEFLSRNDFSDLKKKAKKYVVWRIVAISLVFLMIISAVAVYPHIKSSDDTITVTNNFSNIEQK